MSIAGGEQGCAPEVETAPLFLRVQLVRVFEVPATGNPGVLPQVTLTATLENIHLSLHYGKQFK